MKKFLSVLKVIAVAFASFIAIFMIAHRMFMYPDRLKLTLARMDAGNICLTNGNMLRHEGKLYEAIGAYKDALRFRPNWDIALDNINSVNQKLSIYGNILKKVEEAEITEVEGQVRRIKRNGDLIDIEVVQPVSKVSTSEDNRGLE